VVICLERGADLHMAQLMPLPLTVSCFSKIQIGFTFLVPAYLGSPGQRAVNLMCVRVLNFTFCKAVLCVATRWWRKPAGIDVNQNYVTVTLCIHTWIKLLI